MPSELIVFMWDFLCNKVSIDQNKKTLSVY